MNDKTLTAIREFLEAFEAVFGTDWEYTKSMLGIHEETPDQAAAVRKLGMESIPIIAADGTFLTPKIENESEDWGYRGMLLERYRRLKSLIAQAETTP